MTDRKSPALALPSRLGRKIRTGLLDCPVGSRRLLCGGARGIEAELEYSYHSLILLVGFAVAGLALVGAIAVGPYGRRGARIMLAMVSFAAFLGSAFWLMTYLGFVDQRRAIET